MYNTMWSLFYKYFHKIPTQDQAIYFAMVYEGFFVNLKMNTRFLTTVRNNKKI